MNRLFSNRSIARRLQLGVGVAAGLVLGLTVWLNYRSSRIQLEEQTNAQALSELRAVARRLEDFVARIGMLPRSTASRQQALGRDPDPGLVPFLRQLLSQMPKEEVYGIYIAYEHKQWTEQDSMPWVDRKSWPNTTRVKYDYHDPKQEWYNGPKLSRSFYVTEPYFDEGGSDITMVSLTVPVFDAASNFVGVAGADLALDRIRGMVDSIRLQSSLDEKQAGVADEYAYLVSRAGKIVAHPDEQLMLRQGFPGADLTSRPGGRFVAAKPEGFAEIAMDGERRRVYWAESPLTGWKIVLNISKDAILVPVHQLTLHSALIGVAGLLALIAIVSAIARRLARPLWNLTRTAAAIEQGSFREDMVGDLPQQRDELGELARSFQKMAREIQVREQHLADLNQNLEQTVQQRTAELTARASELETLSRESQERVLLESSLSALNTSLRGNLTVAQVAEQGLAGAVEFLGAPMGALFVAGVDGNLHRLAAHAYPDSADLPQTFAVGSGTVGQAAQSRHPIFTEPDSGTLRVLFGFGAVTPSHIVAYPLLANDRSLGVMELCLFKPLGDLQARWLEKAAETVANALRFALESEERRQAEERTRLILESSAEGIFGVDTEGRITFVNAAACRLLGFNAEEMVGQPSHSLIHHHHPDGRDYPMDQCPMFAAYKRGETSRIDDECLWRKDGAGLPVEYGATPICKDGTIVGAVISFTDITLRKQQEAELQTQHSALESAANAIAITDRQGIIQWVNPAFVHLTGFERQEAIGQNPRVLNSGVHEKAFFQNLWQTILAGSVWQGTLTNKRKNGQLYQEEMTITPVRSKRGEITHFVAVKQDITDRLRAEQELAFRLTFQRALLETIPYPMFVKDAEGRFVGCNKAYEREFGTTSEMLKGKTVLELDYLPEADRRKFHEEDLSVIREASRRSYELPIQYADGRTHVTLYSVDGFKLKDGSPGGLIGLMVDITDQKHIAEELRVAKAKAEEATEMKSMFLANMSHEIRTPMNAIIGLSHLALRTQLTPKQRDYVSKVHNAGTSLLAVINDILDFSKIEAGKLDLETTDFKLDEVISSVTTLTAQKAHEKRLEFLAHVAPGIPEHLLGDPLRLGQILTNFVNNAVKFTEHGEIRLNIELLEHTGEKVQLKFSVRDTGMGMTQEQAAKLFQPFTQADMSTTRKHGGTGLGLTICRRLVELMGGRIWLETEPGVGSTFYFTVWLGVSDAKGSSRRVPERLARLRVLVVDDNAAAREILQEPLSALASRVDVVGSGKEALAAIKQHDAVDPYDIVFMDWRMPGMDGLQVSRHIKSDETLSHQPAIVLVTAFGREEVREEAERLQLDGFLLKPVTKSMIVDTLVSVFAEPGEETAATVETERAFCLRGARILLAEDNDINQQIAIELLQGAGATVHLANNGREAVETVFHGPQPPPFDVVLMDLQMPEMDGYQATAKLRSDARFAALPIIAMTAHATIEERQSCLDAGMNDHISKPIDPDNLFETVGRYYKPLTPSDGERVPEDRAGGTESDLPNVDGLDTRDGLGRVAGNRKLYLKLLRQFVEQQDPAQIAAQLKAGDRAAAERTAHTVKGVAANLGAKAVQAAAGDLEKALHEGGDAARLEALQRQFEAVLGPFVDRLRAALGDGPAAPEAPAAIPLDPGQLRLVVAQMMQHLAEFDPAASECLEANRGAFASLFSTEAFGTFARQVQGYAFGEAQAQLEQAARERGI